MLCICSWKKIIWENADFFFQKYPFLYNQTGFSKTNNALQKRKKIILSTLKFWQEKLIWALFFHEWKNKQINFASQNLCVETYFFYTDVRENKIFRSSFSTSCWKTKKVLLYIIKPVDLCKRCWKEPKKKSSRWDSSSWKKLGIVAIYSPNLKKGPGSAQVDWGRRFIALTIYYFVHWLFDLSI